WHNGRAVESSEEGFVFSLNAGSNDVLLSVSAAAMPSRLAVRFQSPGRVEAVLPEKLGELADRLSGSTSSSSETVPPEFLKVDWTAAMRTGNAERGRKLFSADALGCVKCHAIRPNQKGGGGPSLAGAAGRFTVPHVV